MLKKVLVVATVIVVTILVVLGLANTASYETLDPVEFNDQLVIYHENFIDPFINLIDSDLESMTTKEIEAELDKLKDIASASLAGAKALVAPSGGEELKQAAIDLFSFYEEVITGDYRDLLILSLKGEGNLTSEEEAQLQEVGERISEDGLKYESGFGYAQEDFAEANGFELMDYTTE